MASSFVQIVQANHPTPNESIPSDLSLEDRNRLQFILGIVVFCIGIVILFAPERPQQFASICEKYNTVSVCQVW